MLDCAAFFDEPTFSYSYVVWDKSSREAAVIDPLYAYNPVSGKLDRNSTDPIVDFVQAQALEVKWILDTHIHADHLTGASILKERLGGKVCIGEAVTEVQAIFGDVFNVESQFCRNGSQFDRLLTDGERLNLGEAYIEVMHTPGHTPACVTYVAGNMAFVGDTLFMPDYGTARADFPGGDAARLYSSIQKILALPEDTRLMMCHDYGTETRKQFLNETTVAAQRENNIHLCAHSDASSFAEFRNTKDADLAAPRLLYPAVQFNMRGGQVPPPEANGVSYFKTPIKS